jgi:hypothetical protein
MIRKVHMGRYWGEARGGTNVELVMVIMNHSKKGWEPEEHKGQQCVVTLRKQNLLDMAPPD